MREVQRFMSSKVWTCGVVLGLGAQAMFAQQPAPSPVRSGHVLQRGAMDSIETAVVRIPFDHVRQHVLVHGTLHGKSGVFMLDTGAPQLIVNTALGVVDPIADSVGVMFENGQRAQRYVYRTSAVTWGGLTTHHLSAIGEDLTGLAQFLGVSSATPLLGIVGLAQLEPFTTVFDYAAGQLELYPVDSAGTIPSALRATLPAPLVVPLEAAARSLFVATVIGDTSYSWMLDMGANASLDVHSVPALGTHVRQTGESTTNTSFGGTVMSVPIVVVDTLRIGSAVYTSLRMMVTNAPTYTSALPGGRRSIGVLGDEFFAQQRVGLNLRGHALYIWGAR